MKRKGWETASINDPDGLCCKGSLRKGAMAGGMRDEGGLLRWDKSRLVRM